ncbi:MAG: thioredoxin domain-containing protein [Planctomycetota bacterium]
MLSTTLIVAALLAAPQNAPKPAAERPAQAAPELKPLGIGDAAPAFAVDTWVKGEPFEKIEAGNVYVMEFWATWCGPCIAAIPHLTELQKKYPDVRFVGVAASESGSDEGAKLGKVKGFVEGKGDAMGYRVAYVGDRAKMSRPWMEAAGQRGIPCTFIVGKDAKVAWIGHPMQMDQPLAQIVAGTWDAGAAAKDFANKRAAADMQRGIAMAMRDASKSGDYTKAVAAMRAALEKAPTDQLKFQLMTVLAGPADQPAEAWKLAEEIYESNKGDAMAMNQLAWTLVDPEGAVKKPNLDIAMKAAERCVELTKSKDASMIDTLARVHFLKGDVARAVSLQKQAIEASADEKLKESMEKTLAEYEAALKKA